MRKKILTFAGRVVRYVIKAIIDRLRRDIDKRESERK